MYNLFIVTVGIIKDQVGRYFIRHCVALLVFYLVLYSMFYFCTRCLIV